MRTIALTAKAVLIFVLLTLAAAAADIAPFVGDFDGSAELRREDGSLEPRDMSVSISKTKAGFAVEWSSVTYKTDGRRKAKTYKIEFQPTEREFVYVAAMQRNVFGHAVPLDPMKGEPYVWGRIVDDTLTVFSLYVSESGGYELQQFDRTLADGGLTLHFQRFSNGVKSREVETFLKRAN